MRRPLLAMLMALGLAVSVSSCGGSKSTAPAPDPNQAMYGTWNGNLIETVQTSGGPVATSFVCSIVFGKGSVAFYVDGVQYPAAMIAMQDPNSTFQVTNGSAVIGYVSTRAGSTLNGGGSWPDGFTSDVFALTKASVSTRALPAASAQFDPRFGSH